MPLLRGEVADRRPPLGVAGHEDEPQVRELPQQPAVHVEDDGLFPFMRAARHEDAGIRRHLQLGGLAGPVLAAHPRGEAVVLGIPHDTDVSRRRPERPDTIGVHAGDDADLADRPENFLPEKGGPRIPPEGPGRDAPVDHDNRNRAPRAMPQEVGPQFRFRQDDDVRGDFFNDRPHDPGEVEREIGEGRGPGNEPLRHGLARLRSGRQEDAGAGEPSPQGGNNGRRRRHLPHRHGVDPDPGAALEGGDQSPGDPAQLLPDAGAILSRHEDPDGIVGREEHEARKQREVVEHAQHRPTIMRFRQAVKLCPCKRGKGSCVYGTGHVAHGEGQKRRTTLLFHAPRLEPCAFRHHSLTSEGFCCRVGWARQRARIYGGIVNATNGGLLS